jgi:hypothetical protein
MAFSAIDCKPAETSARESARDGRTAMSYVGLMRDGNINPSIISTEDYARTYMVPRSEA